MIRLNALILSMLAFLPCHSAWASYAIFVGKNLTADGSTLIGGTGDEPSSHWLEIVPRATHPAGSTIRVGVTKESIYPGQLIDIPQAPVTANGRHPALNYRK